MLKSYRASCHCSRVQVEVGLDLSQPSYRCNCSICRRSRFWPAIASPENFRLITGEKELTLYVFGSQRTSISSAGAAASASLVWATTRR